MGDPGSGLHTSERSEEVDGGGLDAIHLDGDCRYLDNPTMRGLAHLPLELVPARSGVTGTGTTMSVPTTSESLENP